MTTRVTLLGLLCCATLIGVGADRPAGPTANPEGQEVPQLPSLTHFGVVDLELPPEAGRPFDMVVSLDNEQYTLTLRPYSLRADDFRLLVQGADGTLREVDAPPPATLRGHVQGVARSRVAASLIDGQLSATIVLDGQDVWVIEPLARLTGRWAPQAAHVIYRGHDVAPLWPNFCGVEDLPPAPQGGQQVDGQGGVAGTGMKIVDFAADADFEFYQKNGSSVSSTMFDIETVMNDLEFIFERDTDISYEVTTIVVRTVSGPPYTSSGCVALLNQFANAWNTSPENLIRRDVAQLFTGKNLTGCLGIAVTPSVCNIPNAYSLVESRAPGLPFNVRVALSAHELGHSWNALHCSGSTCHIMCGQGLGFCGGISGSNLKFGPVSVNAIVNYSNAVSCLTDLPEPLDPPFFDEFGPSSVPDPEKWIYSDGAFASLNAENEPSGERSLNLDAGGPGEYQDDEIRSNVINLAGTSGNVFSYYTQHRGVEAGEQLFAEYWVESILRWIPLNIITSDGVDQDTFTFHSHDLAGAAENNEFRIRFRVEVDNLNDDWYIDDVFVGQPTVCPEDLDGDGSVGILDLLALLAAWGSDPGGPPDFDNDGDVGILDLLTLLAAWGPCP
ncbi:MAG: M12 family metallo-peptidase [Planctomycetota bacterium]|nr:M12 family metallo-peptidase [Planctomycetota bacterium]